MPDIRFHHGQDHLVRLVPGPVDIILAGSGTGIRLQLQGILMLHRQNAGEDTGISEGRQAYLNGKGHGKSS